MSDMTRLHRGLVLQALHGQYPHHLTEIVLERSVQSLMLEGSELERVLAYLEDKGLIERTTEQLGRRKLRLFKLTAQGMDLVDGSTDDPGVDLGADG